MLTLRMGLLAVLGLLLPAMGYAHDAAQKPATKPNKIAIDPYQQRIVDAARQFDKSGGQQMEKALAALMDDPGFESASASQQSAVLMLAGTAAVYDKKLDRARELLLRSTRVDEAAHAWYMLAFVEMLDQQGEPAARYLSRAIELGSADLDQYNEFLVTDVLRLSKPAKDARVKLMQALYDAGWDDNGLGASRVWYELAEARLQQGEPARAQRAIERVDGAMDITMLLVDRRFDGIRADIGNVPTPEYAARRRVTRLRALVAAQPRRLDGVTELMSALLVVGEWNDVIRLSDDVQGRLKAAAPDEPAFDEMGQLAWAMNLRSSALLAAGRTEEALAELKAAAATSELGQANVSQILNLGDLYCRLGRADEALRAIEPVGQMSGYGRMVQASVQLRAALLKHDARGAEQGLDYMRKHRADSEAILLEGLLFSGHLEEAAREYIAQLESVDTRASALLSAQKFRQITTLPGDVALADGWKAVLARDDVMTALLRVGRVGTFGIYRDWNNP